MPDKYVTVSNSSTTCIIPRVSKSHGWQRPPSSAWPSALEFNLGALPSTWNEIVVKVTVRGTVNNYDWSVGAYRDFSMNRAFVFHIMKDDIENSDGRISYRTGSAKMAPSITSGIDVQNYDYVVTIIVDQATYNKIMMNAIYFMGRQVSISNTTQTMDVVYR